MILENHSLFESHTPTFSGSNMTGHSFDAFADLTSFFPSSPSHTLHIRYVPAWLSGFYPFLQSYFVHQLSVSALLVPVQAYIILLPCGSPLLRLSIALQGVSFLWQSSLNGPILQPLAALCSLEAFTTELFPQILAS